MTLPPNILAEWHPTLNSDISPEKITRGSSKKVWWKCRLGHEWQCVVNKRTKGQGCPFCSGRRPCKDNCLKTLNPDLAKQWHPYLNKKLTPQDVTANCGKKVWWKCDKGHEWEAQIKSRNYGKNCPVCSGRVASKENSFKALSPHLLKEWHPTKNGKASPEKLKPRSGKRVWWLCEKGHEWESTLHNRGGGYGCPYCSGHKVSDTTNLEYLQPDMAKEWHPTKNGDLTPKEVALNYSKKVWWKCAARGHEWAVSPNSRVRGTGCPYCNSVATSRLELRLFAEFKYIFDTVSHREKILGKEIDVYLPQYKIGFEIDGAYWHKNKFRKDMQKYQHFTNNGIFLIPIRGEGLKQLSEIDIVFKTNEQHIEIIKRLVKCLLENTKHTLKETPVLKKYLTRSRYINNSFYKEMMFLLPGPLPGESLEENNKDLSQQWHPNKNSLSPRDFSPNSNQKVWWMCNKGHEWKTSIANRNKGTGCPFCVSQAVCFDNCLATAAPAIAEEWHPSKNGMLTPNDIIAGSGQKVWWRCKKGHEWETAVGSRTQKRGGTGCPECSIKKRSDTLRGNITEMQKIASTRGGECLSEIYLTARLKLKWQCSEGHTWEAIPDSIKRGTWCPKCPRKRKSGINS